MSGTGQNSGRSERHERQQQDLKKETRRDEYRNGTRIPLFTALRLAVGKEAWIALVTYYPKIPRKSELDSMATLSETLSFLY